MIDLRVHDHELDIYDAAYTRAPVARTRERVRAVRYPRKVMLTNVCLYGPLLRPSGPAAPPPPRAPPLRARRPAAADAPTHRRAAAPGGASRLAANDCGVAEGHNSIRALRDLSKQENAIEDTRASKRASAMCDTYATLLSTALPLERGSNSAMERAGRSSVHRNQEPHRGRAGSQVKRHRPSPSLTVPIEHSDTAARTLLSTRSSVRQQAIGKRYSSTGPPGG